MKKDFFHQHQVVLVFSLLYVAYWVTMAVVDASAGVGSFSERLINIDSHELWHRFLGFAIFISAGFYVSKLIEGRKQAEEKLKERSDEIKMFAYSVCHDLKSPVIGIHGMADKLTKRYTPVLDEDGKNYCRILKGLSEHLAHMVENINIFIQTKELPVKFEEMDMKELLDTVREEFASRLQEKQIRWIEPGDLPIIRGDRIALCRMFRNLVDNSLKYGGDKLSQIEIKVEEEAYRYIVSFSDNGNGIPSEHHERIFEPFKRASKNSIMGSGIGLAIVKEVAEIHGGRAWITSAPNQGTTFFTSFQK